MQMPQPIESRNAAVLVVEDDPLVRRVLTRAITAFGHDVDAAARRPRRDCASPTPGRSSAPAAAGAVAQKFDHG